ncbi:hypothetical protein AOL_s00079g278 [Orbilia oligospora ATCC 24927]|uniref:Glycine zipper 2TM domain-containing protein n=1 Tax=Arthrobotrys oligospora (strain ATCC 24927 / CBS 115.81 / DSM 1491) TaxID=756982 RepID=G1XCV8_ARTOA|nr:hypothetical protein AOL_s00079g278 [Orbilia oligospora ATCC 24927]EGX49057.1 hypothetical protein AOL_s00079g278 [Orbilia oligospora ATCC 24927]
MQFTTIILSIFASTTLIAAAPVPEPVVGAIAGAVVGVGCAFQAEQCQKVGDGVKEGVKESGHRQWDAAKDDGGWSVGTGKGGFFPGGWKKE